MSITSGRSSITLYSDGTQYSHRIRLMWSVKQIVLDVIHIESGKNVDRIGHLSPYGKMPILQDRDLVLYETGVIMEYLEERFPYPPLLPGDPKERANCRLMMYRLQHEWCNLADVLLHPAATESSPQCMEARRKLRASLLEADPIFYNKPFFMSECFTMADCCVLPLLWRLPLLKLKLPQKRSRGLQAYMDFSFGQPAFQKSLTENEREMREISDDALAWR